MRLVLQVFLIVCVLIFLAIIVHYLAKKKLNLRYSLVWLGTGLGMLVLAIFPQIATAVSGLVGIDTPVNTVFLFAGMFMLLIIFTLTIIVSHMNNQIYRLTQKQAILEKRVRELEKSYEPGNCEGSGSSEETNR